jgi:hypothetical protein
MGFAVVFGIMVCVVGLILVLYTVFLATRTIQLVLVLIKTLWNHSKVGSNQQQAKASPAQNVVSRANNSPEHISNLVNLFKYTVKDCILFFTPQHNSQIPVEQVENKGNTRYLKGTHNPSPKSLRKGFLHSIQIIHLPRILSRLNITCNKLYQIDAKRGKR